MRNDASRRVFDYWTKIKGNEPAPLRNDIEPGSLRHLLPHLFIAGLSEGGGLEFRLAGTRICDLFGRELRGCDLSALWLQSDGPLPGEIARTVLRDERPASIDAYAVNGELLHGCEVLLLPVRSAPGETSDRLLGAVLPQDTPFPPTGLPFLGLVLESWAFLTQDGELAHAGPSLSGETGHFSWIRRQLSPRRLLPQQRRS